MDRRLLGALLSVSLLMGCSIRLDPTLARFDTCQEQIQLLRAEVLTQGMMGTLQEYQPPVGMVYLGLLLALERHTAEELGVFVAYAPLKRIGMWGATPFSRQVVIVEASLSPDGRLEVLAHELGHLYHPFEWEREASEAFAETVGMLVQLQLGIEWRYSYGIHYLRTFLSPGDYIAFTVAHQDVLCEAVAKIVPSGAAEAP